MRTASTTCGRLVLTTMKRKMPRQRSRPIFLQSKMNRSRPQIQFAVPWILSMFRPALTIMTGRTLGYAVLFLLPLILVRLFGQEEFGTYKQVFLLYGTILSLAQVGMSESLFYFLPGAGERSGRYV